MYFLIAVLLLNILFAGFLQLYFGIPKLFMTSVSVVLLGLYLLFNRFSLEQLKEYKLDELKMDGLFILILLFIFTVSAGKSLLSTSIYHINIILPYIIFRYFKFTSSEYQFIIEKIIVIVGIIQLPIIILQRVFYEELIAGFSSVRYEDAGFGTFNIANDHALGFFLIIVFLLLVEKKLFKSFQRVITVYIGVTIFFLNSLITLAIFLSLMIYLLFRRKKIPGIAKFLILGLGIVISIISVNKLTTENLIIKRTVSSFSKLDIEEMPAYSPNRFQETVLIILQDKKIIGDGAFSYYDLLNDTFILGANYSQFLWFYHDLGIVGLVLFLVMFWYMTKKVTGRPKYMIVGIFLIYSFFTVTLLDFSFLFCYFFYQTRMA